MTGDFADQESSKGTKTMRNTIKLTFPGKFEFVKMAAEVTSSFARTFEANPDSIIELASSVVEAVNNSIEHGYRSQPCGDVIMTLSYRAARLTIANLTDTDPPMMADAVWDKNTDTRMYDIFGRSYTLSLALSY